MSARSVFLAALALGCAARPPAPEPAPSVAPPVAPPTPLADAGAPGAASTAVDDRVDYTSQSMPTSGPGAEGIVSRFVLAANAGDLASAEAYSSAACWQKECGSFAHQAQKKFKVRQSGRVVERGDHAVGAADVVCDGDRKCDFVRFLLARQAVAERVGGASEDAWVWRVADVTEDEKRADAWLESGGPGGAPDNSRGNAAAVIVSLRQGAARCFRAGLAKDPAMTGGVTIHLELDGHGGVSRATLDRTGTISDEVAACIVARAKALRFDPPFSGTLTLPLNADRP